MENTIQLCASCDSVADGDDNFCRQCGAPLVGERLPAKVDNRRALMKPERRPVPAPVKRAVAAVAIGTAVQVGAKLAGRYMAKQAGKKAVATLKSAPKKPAAAVAKSNPSAPFDDAVAVSESFTVRRVWIRRG
jgi:predicted amidophosphoribosyltransferase